MDHLAQCMMTEDRLRTQLSILAVLVCLCACSTHTEQEQTVGPPADREPTLRPFLSVREGKFVDSEGRQVLLHGVNVIDKSRRNNYQSWHGPEEFTEMRQWGFNCLRLGILWDGVEPEPGVYDEAYLVGVDQRIQWAKENGLYVLLDMHQDLFSAKLGADGAPEWAVLDEGKPNIRAGETWGMAYFTSPAIQTAFDNFWENKPAPDGMGVQDHFALAWQHVAARYADEPIVVGYDLFNEPFPGSAIRKTALAKMAAAAKAMAEKSGKKLNISSIAGMIAESDSLIEHLDDFEVYRVFTEAGTSHSQEFERGELADFYTRVSEAIRAVDPNHILFLETHILCNAGTPSGVMPITDSNGTFDPLQAFAPHGYDLVTDTPQAAQPSEARLKWIFQRHAETAERLGLPTLVGEWGAFYGNSDALNAAQMVVRQIEQYRFSDTYWSYGSNREIDEASYFPVLNRPYPPVVAGTLTHCESSFEERRFHCTWQEDLGLSVPTRVYLPEGWFGQGYKVELEPAGNWEFEPIVLGDLSGHLVIAPTGQVTERTLTVLASE